MSEAQTIDNTYIAQDGVVRLAPLLSPDGKLTFRLVEDNAPGRLLHKMGDCLRVVTDNLGPTVVFLATPDADAMHHVYGTVTVTVNRSEVGTKSWDTNIKTSNIDVGPDAVIQYVDKDDGYVMASQAGMASGGTVKFTFSTLYCVYGDSGTQHEYDHPDPNIVIKVVNDPNSVRPDDYPSCDG